jgi:hypothetical protein
MSNIKKLMMSAAGGAEREAIGVAFDDNNTMEVDRSGSLSSFTFSCWFYYTDQGSLFGLLDAYKSGASFPKIQAYIFTNYDGTQSLNIRATSDGNYEYMAMYNNQAVMGPRLNHSWNHIVYSFNGTASQSVAYLNGEALTATYWRGPSSFSIQPNRVRPFSYNQSTSRGQGAYFYFDDSYIDLSVTSNLRKFIDADGLPVDPTTQSLSPEIFLPMIDVDTVQDNNGSLNDVKSSGLGVLANAWTGPNMDPPVAAIGKLYGAHLASASAFAGNRFDNLTFSGWFCAPDLKDGYRSYLMEGGDSSNYFLIRVNPNGSLYILFGGPNNPGGDGSYAFFTNSNTSQFFKEGRLCSFQFSIDFSQSGSAKIAVDGNAFTAFTYNGPPSGHTYFQNYQDLYIGHEYNGQASPLIVSEVILSDDYFDLSTNNPFWDAEKRRHRRVEDVMQDINTPLIASPIDVRDSEYDAGQTNLGSLSDWDSNEGYRFAYRGPWDMWTQCGNFANPNGTGSQRMFRQLSTSLSTIRQTTLSLSFRRETTNVSDNSVLLNVNSNSNQNDYAFVLYFDSSENLNCVYNGHVVANLGNITDTNWHQVAISIDSTTSSSHVYLDGVQKSSSITANRAYNAFTVNIGGVSPNIANANEFDGDIGQVYWTNEYIDLSSGSNKYLFFDKQALPTDLSHYIEDGSVPDPLVFVEFRNPDDLGINSGTAGDFTVYGVTPGPTSHWDHYSMATIDTI